MYILTFMFTLIAVDASGQKLVQVKSLTPGGGVRLVEIDGAEATQLGATPHKPGEHGQVVAGGPLAGYHFVKADSPGLFHLFKGGFMCALPSLNVTSDRKAAAAWETFKFVTADAAAAYLRIHDQGEEAFGRRVRALLDEAAPVCLHFGCGARRLKGFLNIDKNMNFMDTAARAFQRTQEEYYLFDFADKSWPIPDASVDYIYSEDFIEHIPQRSQVAFLAESFRVLKPGAYNRVNTPCLAASMRRHSDFSKGRNGVYFGEFDNWGHIAVLTRGFLADLAPAIGYRQVYFTAKSHGTSPYAVEDKRPLQDRDQDVGNIFADLLK